MAKRSPYAATIGKLGPPDAVDTARYLAKFGAPPKHYLSKPGAASRHERPRKH